MKKDKQRLDLLLVQKGLAESREKAKAMIMAGLVEVNRILIDKPGHSVPTASTISLKQGIPPYVSRGGLKLEAALDGFSLDVADMTLLDVGASTGGFTDCLLQRGAKEIIAIDVGYGQLHWKLRQDPRVRVLEKTNIRYLKPRDLVVTAHGAVIDVSFISLKKVLPSISELLPAQAFVLALIKPQFEVGKGEVGKGGVVRDPALHEKVITELTVFFEDQGWTTHGTIPSPILGPKGNREFFIHGSR